MFWRWGKLDGDVLFCYVYLYSGYKFEIGMVEGWGKLVLGDGEEGLCRCFGVGVEEW